MITGMGIIKKWQNIYHQSDIYESQIKSENALKRQWGLPWIILFPRNLVNRGKTNPYGGIGMFMLPEKKIWDGIYWYCRNKHYQDYIMYKRVFHRETLKLLDNLKKLDHKIENNITDSKSFLHVCIWQKNLSKKKGLNYLRIVLVMCNKQYKISPTFKWLSRVLFLKMPMFKRFFLELVENLSLCLWTMILWTESCWVWNSIYPVVLSWKLVNI